MKDGDGWVEGGGRRVRMVVDGLRMLMDGLRMLMDG